jgi:magnesium transporter
MPAFFLRSVSAKEETMSEAPVSPEGLQTASVAERREILLETSRELLDAGELNSLRLILNSQHPADLADLVRQLGEDNKPRIFELLAESVAAGVLAELDTSTMLEVAQGLDEEELSELVGEMEPDDAADLLSELPEEQSEKVLELLEHEEAEEVRELLEHEEDTGGGIMTSRLVAVREEMSVAAAIAHLREWADEDQIFYIYAVDKQEHLLGTVSIRRLLLARPEVLIRDLTRGEPIAVHTDTDQEEIARLFQEYDLLALPVVDGEGRLVGQVTVDDIVDVIAEEATEDMYVMAATSSEEREERSVLGVVRRRLPWLLVCLGGTLLSGGVIEAFHETLARVSALLLFVPAIMAMGGNTGIQTSTVTVRSLATGQLQSGAVLKTIGRELSIALVMGLVLGGVVFAVSQVWTGALVVGSCVGLAMLAAIVFSAGMGALVPLFFRSVGIDPAVASGPLITTLNDVLSLAIYFTIAASLLSIWG